MLLVWLDLAALRAQGIAPKPVYEQIMQRFEHGTYQKPDRAGISYMTAPLMRTYPAPDATEVMTMVAPHYMFYAPNVKNVDIGGKPGSAYPFVLPQDQVRMTSSSYYWVKRKKGKSLVRPRNSSMPTSMVRLIGAWSLRMGVASQKRVGSRKRNLCQEQVFGS